MSTYVPSWADLKAAWSSGWKALSDQASATYATAAQTDPTGTLARVQAFLSALTDSRSTLDRIATKLPNPPVTDEDRAAVANYQAMEVATTTSPPASTPTPPPPRLRPSLLRRARRWGWRRPFSWSVDSRLEWSASRGRSPPTSTP